MTFLLETIRLGLSNLRLHMLRSILTATGIIFGVAAVIIMVSIGEGAKRDAVLRFERLGAKNIIVRSQKPAEAAQPQAGEQRSFISRFGLTRDDLAAIRENFPSAEAIVPLKEVGGQVWRKNRRQMSQAFATTPELLEVANLRVARGRYLTVADMEDQNTIAIIGDNVAKDLFPWDDPLGETFRIDDHAFTVVGILAPIGLSGGAGAALVGRDMNRDIHIPLTTGRSVMGVTVIRRESGSFQAAEIQISEIFIASPSRDQVLMDAARLRRLMEFRHADQGDVTIIVPYELLEEAKRVALTWQRVLAAVASISLLIGGIGIMNIMLATVTERTREIGIRRAVGATRKHIISQFLVETGVLSCIGGLIGVGLGIGFSVLIGWSVVTMPTHITTWSIFLAFTVASLTGLVFGIYPAFQAARQDPIVALRHD